MEPCLSSLPFPCLVLPSKRWCYAPYLSISRHGQVGSLLTWSLISCALLLQCLGLSPFPHLEPFTVASWMSIQCRFRHSRLFTPEPWMKFNHLVTQDIQSQSLTHILTSLTPCPHHRSSVEHHFFSHFSSFTYKGKDAIGSSYPG